MLTSQKEKLEAKIEELTGTMDAWTAKIEDLVASIASDGCWPVAFACLAFGDAAAQNPQAAMQMIEQGIFASFGLGMELRIDNVSSAVRDFQGQLAPLLPYSLSKLAVMVK